MKKVDKSSFAGTNDDSSTKTDGQQVSQPIAKHNVIGGFGCIPFTKNTIEARIFLEKQGFAPLSFYQGREFIYPIISTWANKNGSWQEKNYSTFNLSEKEDFMMPNELKLQDFKLKILNK